MSLLTLSQAVETCRSYGLTVEAPTYSQPETPRQFCARVGLHIGSLKRTLARLPEAVPVILKRGQSGRITAIRSSASLEQWIAGRKRRAGR